MIMLALVANCSGDRYCNAGDEIAALADPDGYYAEVTDNPHSPLRDAINERLADGRSFTIRVPVLSLSGGGADTLIKNRSKFYVVRAPETEGDGDPRWYRTDCDAFIDTAESGSCHGSNPDVFTYCFHCDHPVRGDECGY
ncbi:MAG TPA: hypothetical protein VGM90_35370 [Kofleriaceae bacterium]